MLRDNTGREEKEVVFSWENGYTKVEDSEFLGYGGKYET